MFEYIFPPPMRKNHAFAAAAAAFHIYFLYQYQSETDSLLNKISPFCAAEVTRGLRGPLTLVWRYMRFSQSDRKSTKNPIPTKFSLSKNLGCVRRLSGGRENPIGPKQPRNADSRRFRPHHGLLDQSGGFLASKRPSWAVSNRAARPRGPK